MLSGMDATSFTRRSGRSSRRYLTVLFAAVALLAWLAAPTAADQPVVVESVVFEGDMIGDSNDDPIGFAADDRITGESAVAFGAGGRRGAAVEVEFERDFDHQTAGWRCRGSDGTGTVTLFDESWSVDGQVMLHDATIEFTFAIASTYFPFTFEGRWTDHTGATGEFNGSGYYRVTSGIYHHESVCLVNSSYGPPSVVGEMSLLADG